VWHFSLLLCNRTSVLLCFKFSKKFSKEKRGKPAILAANHSFLVRLAGNNSLQDLIGFKREPGTRKF
jgi:hypothetical protein